MKKIVIIVCFFVFFSCANQEKIQKKEIYKEYQKQIESGESSSLPSSKCEGEFCPPVN